MFDDFVHCLHLSIGLWVRRGRVTMTNVELLTEIPKIGIVKLLSIIRDNSVRNVKSLYEILPHEFGDLFFRDHSQCLCLDPFGEVIYGYYSVLSPTFPGW